MKDVVFDAVSLFQRAQRVSPGGVHSPVRGFRKVGGTPPFMVSGEGALLKDTEGRSYLDFCLAWGPLLFGHQCPEVKEALHKALDRGWSYGTAEPYSLELAEWLVRHLPWVEKIRFVNSGTEAVMSALRLARAVTGRQKVLKFEGCYHGHADSMLVKAGSGLAEMGIPESAGVSPRVAEETLVIPLNHRTALETAFERHGQDLAAAIVEPIPANYGLLLQEDWFLPSLAERCQRTGTLLIFDEVITGFRIGLQGMAGRTGLSPDLVTYAKVLGGGMPVGAYGGKALWMNHVAPEGTVYQAGTFSANPLGMVASLAMVQKIKREIPDLSLTKRLKQWKEALESFAKKQGIPLQIATESSLFWPILGQTSGPVRSPEDIPASHAPQYRTLFHHLLARGVYLSPSPYEVSFLSTAHTEAQLEKSLEAFQESLLLL